MATPSSKTVDARVSMASKDSWDLHISGYTSLPATNQFDSTLVLIVPELGDLVCVSVCVWASVCRLSCMLPPTWNVQIP